MALPPGLQPLLHDLVPVVAAPTQVWSGPDGQIRETGAQGVYHADRRVLALAVVTVDGHEPEHLTHATRAGRSEHTAALRTIDGPGADPTTWLRRRRTVTPGTLHEDLVAETAAADGAHGTLTLTLASDLATLEAVKSGTPTGRAYPHADPDTHTLTWSHDGHTVHVHAPGATLTLGEDDDTAHLTWHLDLHPGTPQTLGWTLTATSADAVVGPPAEPTPEWADVTVETDDPRLAHLVDRSLGDLTSLRMTAGFAPHDTFLAAGAPWFFTLFGRDSLWAARMLLPLGTRLAAGTLRTLAARQGTRTDPGAAEQPGKILHEVRSATLHLADGTHLPPFYYGTVDATPLWVCLLHDAWQWGLPDDQVEPLLPHLDAALAWIAANTNADGFLDYHDPTGHGLANQGWKDSGDSVQWLDGTLAQGPIALSEVQAYAHEAATGAAALLDHFHRPGADTWRAWAAALADRFRARYWTSDARGPYVGIALDAHGAVVDTVTSNIGHLLGTGILTPDEERTLADRLVTPDMASGYGLRTMSADSGGYFPLRYHGGSVWPHDTAIAVHGLARAGLADHATVLADGLLAAGEHVGYQLPELYSGVPRDERAGLVPYPASCHPQAWSAAAAVSVLAASLGLRPTPGGVEAHPAGPPVAGRTRVHGIRHAGRVYDVEVDATGARADVRRAGS